MGKVSGNWITGAHSGRACNHEDIYTKVNKKTGACYSVKLCNPSDAVSDNQITGRNAFGIVSKALSNWINTNKATNSADYLKVKKMYDAQTKYSTLRGYMMAKGMYTVSADKQTVTVDITARTDFKAAFGIESSSAPSGGSGGQTVTKYTVALSASPSAGGSVSGGGQYNAGASATISAVANSGYTFTRWNDGNTNASRSVTVNSNLNLTATFTQDGSPDENAGGGTEGDDNEPLT